MKIEHENNLAKRIQDEVTSNAPVAKGRTQAELERLSTAGNVRAEASWPDPNYGKLVRAAVETADSTSPAASGPDDSKCWPLKGYSGIHGYATFDGGTNPLVDLQLWAKDEQNDDWILVDSEPGIGPNEEFRFKEGVRSRKVFLRILNIHGTPTSVTLRCSAE